MANENKKRKKAPRQEWKPNWFLLLLYKVWMAAFSVFKIALGAAATVVIILGVCALMFAGTLGDYLQEDILPNAVYDPDGYDAELNSFMYYEDASGNIKLLQNIYADVNREWVDFEDIPENLRDAAVAIEDKRFYEHQGVDWVTTMKACFYMFFGNGDRGGSTITQQLIKNLTEEDSYTVQRKVLEICRATEFEKRYDKEVILELYLNEIYFGQRCNGVKTAAAKYFGKELSMLTLAECASLISITNNPSLYNPYRTNLDAGGMTGAERNRERQLLVLEQMLEQEWITQEEYDEAIAQEIVFKSGIADEDKMAACVSESCGYKGIVSTFTPDNGLYLCPACGTACDLDGDASTEMYSWYVEVVLEDVARDLAMRDGITWSEETRETYVDLIGRSGYHIYTCIDMEVQAQVDAIYTDLSKIPETRSGQQLQSAIVIVDNSNGYIVAISGGVGEKMDYDAFNRATDSKLQTGSSIKPLTVYAPGFESGVITPASVVADMPYMYNGSSPWPNNDNKKYSYSRTIYSAVEDSVNAVAVNTLSMVGTKYSFDFAKDKFGLSGLVESYTASNGQIQSDIDFAPLAMGAQTVGISVRDMACAYATFANEGVYREGMTYTKVYDSDGNLVLDNTQTTRKILSAKAVNYMNYCLDRAVAAGTGTAADFDSRNMNVYGKTGTTSSNRDRWFCGYTGYYTAAIWCGYDTPEQIHLVGNTKNPAARLFSMVMKPLHKGKKNVSLLDTSKMRTVTVCLDSGLIATAACEADVRTGFARTEKVMVYKEDRPEKTCDKHVLVTYCTEGGAVANEYCRLFADAGAIVLEERALVKMTQEQVDAIVKAAKFKDPDNILTDSYIYLVDDDGEDGIFKGMSGRANKGVEAPYIVCKEHTEKSWKEYQAAQTPTEPEEPTSPSVPWWPFSMTGEEGGE